MNPYLTIVLAILLGKCLLDFVLEILNRRPFAPELPPEFAARTTGKPEAMIAAPKKLSVDNLSPLTPHPLKVFFNYRHPPGLARIRRRRGG